MKHTHPKILFLLQLPPPVHGASVVNKNIQEGELINRSFKARYIDISPAKSITDIGKFGFSKFWLTTDIFVRTVFAYVKFRPQLVYMTLSPKGLAFYKDSLIALALKAIGADVVFHLHGKGISETVNKSLLRRKFYQAVFNRASVITLSSLLDSDVAAIADMRMPILHVANGIGSQNVQRKKSNGKIIFCFLSNFVPSKGLENIILAARLLHLDGFDKIEYKFIGGFRDSDYETRIKAMIAEFSEVSFNFTGPLFGEEKLKELANSDVFVYPTENDCFPLVVLEAMSLGLPVIASDQGALPEIVDHGVTGQILKGSSPKELAAVMKKVIVDKEYRMLLGLNGKKKFLNNYTQDIFEKNLVAVLKEITSRNSIAK